jgi:hypothetical protein
VVVFASASADQRRAPLWNQCVRSPHIPLPAKTVTQVLEPTEVVRELGKQPDVLEVDAHIPSLMRQTADKLARECRPPFHRLRTRRAP